MSTFTTGAIFCFTTTGVNLDGSGITTVGLGLLVFFLRFPLDLGGTGEDLGLVGLRDGFLRVFGRDEGPEFVLNPGSFNAVEDSLIKTEDSAVSRGITDGSVDDFGTIGGKMVLDFCTAPIPPPGSVVPCISIPGGALPYISCPGGAGVRTIVAPVE